MSGKTDNAMALVSTLGVTAAARKAVDATWKLGSHGKATPNDPADPEVDLREAILFAILSGAVVGVARMLVARKLAEKERREAQASLLSSR